MLRFCPQFLFLLPVSAMAPVTAHRIEDLITLFDGLFSHSFNTRLVRGGDEPLYLPASKQIGPASKQIGPAGKQTAPAAMRIAPCDEQVPFNRVIFARGFFASALHEIAHWCIAGPMRRQQVDFGYWYAPDGRNAAQQNAFERVEVRPQALEWIFSRAAGCRFFISADNLGGEATNMDDFRQAVHRQVISYCHDGLPARAAQFREALSVFYGTKVILEANQFQLDAL
jgi:elongation factor P hydroxylase